MGSRDTLRTIESPHWVGYAELYCQASDCMVREIRVKLKNHYDYLAPDALRCPFCGGPEVTVHWVRTLEEHSEIQEQQARFNVNAQRYRRDHGGLGSPMTALFDDALPD